MSAVDVNGVIANGRTNIGKTVGTPTVYVALLSYVERDGAGNPVSGGKSINNLPVYVLYWQGMRGSPSAAGLIRATRSRWIWQPGRVSLAQG